MWKLFLQGQILSTTLQGIRPIALKWEKKSVGTASSLHAVNLEVKVTTVATPKFPSFNPMKLMGGKPHIVWGKPPEAAIKVNNPEWLKV